MLFEVIAYQYQMSQMKSKLLVSEGSEIKPVYVLRSLYIEGGGGAFFNDIVFLWSLV